MTRGSLTNLNLSGWNTVKVTSTGNMFRNSSKLATIDLSGWNTESVTSLTNMFLGIANGAIIKTNDANEPVWFKNNCSSCTVTLVTN